jgi:hypothetical protein
VGAHVPTQISQILKFFEDFVYKYLNLQHNGPHSSFVPPLIFSSGPTLAIGACIGHDAAQ